MGQQLEFLARVGALRRYVAEGAVFGAVEGLELCDALLDAFKPADGAAPSGWHHVDGDTVRELTNDEARQVMSQAATDRLEQIDAAEAAKDEHGSVVVEINGQKVAEAVIDSAGVTEPAATTGT